MSLVDAPPPTGWRRFFPLRDRPAITDGELAALLLCNVFTAIGIGGHLARQIQDPVLIEGLTSPWQIVRTAGVIAVGLWLLLGVRRRGPAFIGAASGAAAGFGLLVVGGVADRAWHEVFASSDRLSVIVSPPHLVSFAGLICLLITPIAVVWQRPARRLGFVPSVAVVLSACSAVLVTALFTGFLSPLSGGMSLQRGYVDPLVGEGLQDYDQVRALGIAVWTVVLLVGAFTIVFVRFRLTTGVTALGFVLLASPLVLAGDAGLEPLIAGFAVTGLTTEACVFFLGRPTLGRVGAAVTGGAMGAALWGTTFASLASDGRLAWNPSLSGGTVLLAGLVGAAVASLVALPAPTGDTLLDALGGPVPA